MTTLTTDYPLGKSSRSTAVEILLCCARTTLDSASDTRLRRALATKIPWEFVLDLARHHGLLLMITTHLESLDAETVPSQVRERLGNAVRCRARHDRQLPTETAELHQLLAAESIPTLPFKGPALAALAYRQPQLRQSGDLDLLVRRQDVQRVVDIATQRGYQPLKSRESSDGVDPGPLGHPEKRLILDIHSQFTETQVPGRLAFEEVWERRKTVEVAGQPIDTLCATDSLVATCVSGARARWAKLKWVCDVAELLVTRESEIEWDSLLPMARSLRAERMLALGLLLAWRLLDAHLEPYVRAYVQSRPCVLSLAEQSEGWLLSEEWAEEGPVDDPTFSVRLCDSFGDRLRLMATFRSSGKRPAASRSSFKHLLGF